MTKRRDQNKFNDLKLSRDTISASNFLRREKNALLSFSMKDSALPDTTVVLLSSTVCFHPVLSVNSTIKSCLFLFCCMFSISAHKQLLLSGSTQKQREAVSRDMIKPRKHPTHPFLQWSYNPSSQRTAHNRKKTKNIVSVSVGASRKSSALIFCFSCWFWACVWAFTVIYSTRRKRKHALCCFHFVICLFSCQRPWPDVPHVCADAFHAQFDGRNYASMCISYESFTSLFQARRVVLKSLSYSE